MLSPTDTEMKLGLEFLKDAPPMEEPDQQLARSENPRAREAKNAETYGSARWAQAKEIEQVQLLEPDGVVLERYQRSYLRHDGPEHVLCFAPTRSGKASKKSWRAFTPPAEAPMPTTWSAG